MMRYTAFGDNHDSYVSTYKEHMATWTGKTGDYFSGCDCCECMGKHCLMNHPGHSHKNYYGDFNDGILVDEIQDILVKMKREGEPRQMDLLVILG